MTSEIIYTGGLRTEAKHVQSGSKIITDAPTDNHGKGEVFSPTDLTATSLATCMLTTMGIAANTHNINMDGTKASVQKTMAANPRRISEIKVVIDFPKNNYSEKEKTILKNTALTCPVAVSLHPDIKQEVTFNF
jgi:putative redox protein